MFHGPILARCLPVRVVCVRPRVLPVAVRVDLVAALAVPVAALAVPVAALAVPVVVRWACPRELHRVAPERPVAEDKGAQVVAGTLRVPSVSPVVVRHAGESRSAPSVKSSTTWKHRVLPVCAFHAATAMSCVCHAVRH